MGPGPWLEEHFTMSDIESGTPSLLKLTSANYNVWAITIQGKLMTTNTWQITTGELEKPNDAAQAAEWMHKREKAAGILLGSLSHTQYIHIEGIMDDPIAMWKKLKDAHRSQIANGRYHAIQKLLRIQKDDTESLTEYFSHITSATNDLIALAPSTLTATDIINEIGVHAAISGLDQTEYGMFTSSLLLLGDLDHGKVATAF
jgi:gag-polypeptide of LTR copia-type